MLVLSRKRNEWITIGESIGMRLRRISRGRHGPQLQLWLKGPPSIDFRREELFDAMSEEEQCTLRLSLPQFLTIDSANPIDWTVQKYSESLSGILELDRYKDEKILIAGGLITITVVDIREDKARFGLEAPRKVRLHRLEVFEAIRRESA